LKVQHENGGAVNAGGENAGADRRSITNDELSR